MNPSGDKCPTPNCNGASREEANGKWCAESTVNIEFCPDCGVNLLTGRASIDVEAARRERAEEIIALISNPYSDEIEAIGPDEPSEVADKIVKAIRTKFAAATMKEGQDG
jgi:hypothetical protein